MTEGAAMRPGYDGRVAVDLGRDPHGRHAYAELRSSGTLAVRAIGGEAWLVGAGAHPIGGDRLHITLRVRSGAELRVRSTSATVARASVPPAPSTMDIHAVVEDGASLCWAPAPGVAACGSSHVTSSRISLGAASKLWWSDVIVLGRVGEEPGSWANRMRVTVAGAPLLVSEHALGPAHPAWSSAAVFGGATCTATLLVVNVADPPPCVTVTHSGGYLVPVGDSALAAVTWGSTAAACCAAARALCDDPAVAPWVRAAFPQVVVAA